SNNSKSAFTPKKMFKYSPALLNIYLHGKSDLKFFSGAENGFKATLLDLVNKEYIIFLNTYDSNLDKKNKHNKGLFVKINEKKGVSKLKPYEMDVINFLKPYGKKGAIPLYFIKEDLNNLKPSKKFESKYKSWKKHLENEYSTIKFFKGDSSELMKELNDFKSYISGQGINNADIYLDDINKYLVYGVALGIEKETMKNFEKYFDKNTLRDSEIYQILKFNGLNFVEQGIKGSYLIKSGDHNQYTGFYGY
ncbi:MAG TPA: hypothetical protein VK426_02460, partial [Methanobacterium sp.]|nr:hypothetical protein [Methanobacterium sp.]